MDEYMIKAVVDGYNQKMKKSKPVQKSKVKKDFDVSNLIFSDGFGVSFEYIIDQIIEKLEGAKKMANKYDFLINDEYSLNRVAEDPEFVEQYNSTLRTVGERIDEAHAIMERLYEVNKSKKAKKSKVRKNIAPWDLGIDGAEDNAQFIADNIEKLGREVNSDVILQQLIEKSEELHDYLMWCTEEP